jgi:hypothetical protein
MTKVASVVTVILGEWIGPSWYGYLIIWTPVNGLSYISLS